MRFSSFIVIVATLLVNAILWEETNRPVRPNESSYPIKSLSYNPFQKNQSPFRAENPTQEQIAHDLKLLSGKTQSLRLYTSTGVVENMPEMVRPYGIKLIASAWLGHDQESNKREVEAAIRMTGRNRNVVRLIIGNETQLHKTVPRQELIEYLRQARKRLRTPVSTAEPWDFWINNPDFVKEVDYLAIHVLPYWNEIPISSSVDYVLEKYRAVKNTYPYKMVIIAETGWPSDGPQRREAEASLTNQARFVREFIDRAQGINYNIIEAFDQPWKSVTEGSAGEHWGIIDASRQEKFPISGPVLEDPKWRYWAVSSSLVGFLAILLFLSRRRQLHIQGQLFSAAIIQAIASAIAILAREAADEYMSPGDIVFWTVMLTAQALLAIIFVTDTAEVADVIGKKPLKRRFTPVRSANNGKAPLVSIHLACCKEPPALVIATLDSLARLDYPNIEVIVVDNNTPDENLWHPVKEHCSALGPQFRFYSLGPWPGFKAGALNFALRQTDPRAEVVAIVDADYIVSPDWLTATIPYFQDQNVAVVQAPQEHRGWENNLFRKMENDEYSGFFRIGMVQRNEDNAIIQHGTMTLIRRSDLDNVGGWAEWCICEDAELGLRLLSMGRLAVYLDHVFGRGLVPDSFEAYAKQRFRWAYGAIQILKFHALTILGFRPGLSVSQRYQFIKGWLPWIGDSLHLLFTFAALVWSAVLLMNPLETEFPEPIFIYPAIALVVLRFTGMFWTYSARVKIGIWRTLVAMLAGGALTHTIAKAVLQSFVTSGKPFYRTPKMDPGRPFLRSIITAWQEILLGTALCAAAFAIIGEFSMVNDEALLWASALLIQAIPYCSTLIVSIVSSFSFNESPPLPLTTSPAGSSLSSLTT